MPQFFCLKKKEPRSERLLVGEILGDIKQNLEMINHHGKRADAIVKGILEHSKRGSGQEEPTDLNVMAEGFLRLNYQSFLAKEPEFKAELKTDFDPNLPKVSAIPKDMGKVLLNLMNNAFYATNEPSKGSKPLEGFKPFVTVSTKNPGDKLEIEVSDNDPGIPDSIKEKKIQPFFKTKPTGSGTGLGLSLSYDIVKTHGGELVVKAKSDMEPHS